MLKFYKQEMRFQFNMLYKDLWHLSKKKNEGYSIKLSNKKVGS